MLWLLWDACGKVKLERESITERKRGKGKARKNLQVTATGGLLLDDGSWRNSGWLCGYETVTGGSRGESAKERES